VPSFLPTIRRKGGSIFIKKFAPDFPGETFCFPKEKEEKQYGEYRTRRMVLEAWNGLRENLTVCDSNLLLDVILLTEFFSQQEE
jgi:hypothetical protein